MQIIINLFQKENNEKEKQTIQRITGNSKGLPENSKAILKLLYHEFINFVTIALSLILSIQEDLFWTFNFARLNTKLIGFRHCFISMARRLIELLVKSIGNCFEIYSIA